jgi:hypothetical protein
MRANNDQLGGNESSQCTMIDHRHGNVTTGMPETLTLQDASGGTPLSTTDDGIMVSGLVILVLFPVIPFGFVIVEVRCPGFAGKDIPAVPFVP